MLFRKKPVVIEAVQFTGNFDEIEKFVGGDAEWRDGQLLVATLEGPLRASTGDWIIRGVKGEFYPCKPDIFEATYERVLQAVEVAGRVHTMHPDRDQLTEQLGLTRSDVDELVADERSAVEYDKRADRRADV